jgi:hypothetical protein
MGYSIYAEEFVHYSILKQIKTGWFSKSSTTPRSPTPLFYTSLFGNRSQLGMQVSSGLLIKITNMYGPITCTAELHTVLRVPLYCTSFLFKSPFWKGVL